MKSVVNFAHEILTMEDELRYLREENYRLQQVEERYNELLNDSIQHGERMMGQLFRVFLTPGVVDACVANSKNLVSSDSNQQAASSSPN